MKSAVLALFAAIAWSQPVTIAGTGVAGSTGGAINNPYGLVTGPDGALYFCEIGNHRVSRLDLKRHVLSTVAGSGQKGYSGDGGPALEALLNEPYEVRFDKAGNLYFAEMQSHVVRRVDVRTHVITTVAGTGVAGFSGDGGPAAKAQLRQPHSIVFDPQGRLLICDIGNYRVRRVDFKTGIIETWAGNGERAAVADGTPVASAPLNEPRAIAVAPNGDMYLVVRRGNAVYRIDGKTERIYHVAGTGETGYSGDGGLAKTAKLAGPKGIAVAPDGSLYLADTENHAIRRIDKDGLITTVVGGLARPHGVFVASDGKVYVADSEHHRILMN
jgi:DNA-binding beta-propeller fold protein YncE